VRQPGRFELGDRLLDHRVPAVIGLEFQQVTIAIGDHGVVVELGEQRQL
jgi:hypothetical protein